LSSSKTSIAVLIIIVIIIAGMIGYYIGRTSTTNKQAKITPSKQLTTTQAPPTRTNTLSTTTTTPHENLEVIPSYPIYTKNIKYLPDKNAYMVLEKGKIIKIKGLINGLSHNATLGNGTAGWLVTIVIKNTGPISARITQIYLNNIPINKMLGVIAYNGTDTVIKPGETRTLYIILQKDGTKIMFTPGIMVNIKIHTASGRTYPTTIVLP